mmetsp:Transcript_71766/g.126377  ORF Transcript_71766/g.126377 Transcript_71766/m.126377 type:complete len:261 (-) Transcript_71766:45-827(-)
MQSCHRECWFPHLPSVVSHMVPRETQCRSKFRHYFRPNGPRGKGGGGEGYTESASWGAHAMMVKLLAVGASTREDKIPAQPENTKSLLSLCILVTHQGNGGTRGVGSSCQTLSHFTLHTLSSVVDKDACRLKVPEGGLKHPKLLAIWRGQQPRVHADGVIQGTEGAVSFRQTWLFAALPLCPKGTVLAMATMVLGLDGRDLRQVRVHIAGVRGGRWGRIRQLPAEGPPEAADEALAHAQLQLAGLLQVLAGHLLPSFHPL